MKLAKVICIAGVATTFVAGVWGCATTQSADAKLSAQVQTVLDQQPNLDAPSIIGVQTVNSTVYLNGLVSTDLERRAAADAAEEVPGVERVVNSIALEN